jgi:hypothetical protein
MTGPTATPNHKSQSLNFRYILTSGLAGGIAGCVVRLPHSLTLTPR